MRLYFLFFLLFALAGCEPEPKKETNQLFLHNCTAEDECNTDEDPYCDCGGSAQCQKYCPRLDPALFSIVRGGRICGKIFGCIPPIDARELRIIFFTTNPAESISYIRTIAGNNNEVFAKGELESYDKERSEATFKYNIVAEELAEQELVVSITTFTKEKEGQLSLTMESDPFPKGHFTFK
ncbi:hypothetical protein LVD17_06175 [Fulvivirga ulvae]|uniref:hypothetical protein n=1 Tax=Fulvivirga ulvae TaxID=2904245 RepID=UPI001F36E30D|nr:hypothetical protein [Fulvivirga ulvae]UII33407.1 hypothetical protein LVD17_06175 [Fulvivirga ulvae]